MKVQKFIREMQKDTGIRSIMDVRHSVAIQVTRQIKPSKSRGSDEFRVTIGRHNYRARRAFKRHGACTVYRFYRNMKKP